MRRRAALALVAVAMLAGPLTGNASGQQRTPPAPGPSAGDEPISQVVVADLSKPDYAPAPFEVPGFQFPLLSPDVLDVIAEDEAALKFDVGNELGGFAIAPAGGSAFFGRGRPIFGLAAPPLLPSGSLRPDGSDPLADRFLGEPPAIPETSVIPKLGETTGQARESFAFVDGPPPLVPPEEDTGVFPLPETVAADTNGPLPDNVPTTPATPTPTPTPTPDTGTGTTTPSLTPTTATPTGTTLPPVTTPTPPSTTPRPPTTTTPPKTTTPPTTPITSPPTTAPPTATTLPPVTTPPPATTTPPPTPSPLSFVMGNQREQASVCLAVALSANSSPACDRLFDVADLRPGQPVAVNLTLWNVNDSQVDAASLRLFASGPCVGGTDGPPPHGTGDLCDGIQLKVERFATASRTGSPSQCIYGCGSSSGGSLSDFAGGHPTPADGVEIGDGFAINEKAYLVLTAILPDTGTSSQGHGNDNRYLARTADIRLTWQMTYG